MHDTVSGNTANDFFVMSGLLSGLGYEYLSLHLAEEEGTFIKSMEVNADIADSSSTASDHFGHEADYSSDIHHFAYSRYNMIVRAVIQRTGIISAEGYRFTTNVSSLRSFLVSQGNHLLLAYSSTYAVSGVTSSVITRFEKAWTM